MLPIDGDLLREIAPKFSGANGARQAEIIEGVGPILRATLAKYDITTALRIAHFVAQIGHESAGYRTTEEFASGAAYEGRADLGNTEPGDGKRYKGRGLLQLTGRFNYRKYGGLLGLDLEGDPVQAAEPRLSLEIACHYWRETKINPDCDNDDLIAVTKKVNGGLRGLDDRRAYLSRAKDALAKLEATGIIADSDPAERPILRRGSRGSAVVELQQALRAKGFPVGVDGDFGPGTETAVKSWQAHNEETNHGIVDLKTWASLLA